MTRAARRAMAVLCAAAVFTAFSSVAFTLLTGRFPVLGLDGALWAWWRYAYHLAPHPGDAQALLWSAGVGAASAAVFLLLPDKRDANGRRRLVRGRSGIHGRSNWLPMPAALAMLRGSGDGIQMVVGEATRMDLSSSAEVRYDPRDESTWGPGGHGQLLFDRCQEVGAGHNLTLIAPGGGKTAELATKVAYWGKSAFVLDPACELADLTQEIQEEKGHTVYVLDPETDTGFNALSWIDTAHPLAEVNVRAQVGRAYGKTSARPGQTAQAAQFFRDQGKNLVAALLAHMLWSDAPADAKTLRAVRAGLTVPEDVLRDTLEGIYLTSNSQLARDLAGPLFRMVPETFDGIASNAQEATAWLSVAVYASMVSGGTYDPAELCNGRTTVYCQIPMKALLETPEVARVVVGSHMGAVFEAEGMVDGIVSFKLDEAVLLDDMKELVVARSQGRKYRMVLSLYYQSEGQALGVWGAEGWRAWCDETTYRIYGPVADLKTAEDLSKLIGSFGAVAESEGANSGRQARLGEMQSVSRGTNTNRHEVSRPVMHPFELMRIRTDERVVIYRSAEAIRCTAAISFRRPELRPRLGQNRFRREYPRPGLRRVA